MEPSEQIDKLITELNDWRGKMIADIREIIRNADSGVVEEWKWMGTPCWSCAGLICVANAHKNKVKIIFSQGANLFDPNKLFNSDLEGRKWRAIDIYQGDKIDKSALKDLVIIAIAFNKAKKIKKG